MILWRFYTRRALRILPLFYVALLVLQVVVPAEIHDSLPWHLAYASNYYCVIRGTWLGPASHFWSLAIEEQFYLVWPLALLFSRRALLPALIALGILIGPLSRMLGLQLIGNEVSAFTLTTSCLDSLGAGAMLAYLPRPGGALTTARAAAGDAIAAGALVSYLALQYLARTSGQPRLDFVWAGLMVSVFAFGVIHSLVARRKQHIRVLSWRPFTYLGTISYGMYVWHYALTLAITIAVASVSWYCLERPFNRLRSRFPYTPRAVWRPAVVLSR